MITSCLRGISYESREQYHCQAGKQSGDFYLASCFEITEVDASGLMNSVNHLVSSCLLKCTRISETTALEKLSVQHKGTTTTSSLKGTTSKLKSPILLSSWENNREIFP